jgi:hypothetical protein
MAHALQRNKSNGAGDAHQSASGEIYRFPSFCWVFGHYDALGSQALSTAPGPLGILLPLKNLTPWPLTPSGLSNATTSAIQRPLFAFPCVGFWLDHL